MEASVSIWVWAGIIAFCCRVRVSLVAFSHIEPDGKCGREGAHMGTERLRSANETRAVRTAGARVSVFGILTTLFGLLLCASLSGCSSESGKLDINVNADGWQGGAVSVSVNGKSDKGDSVSKTVSVTPGEGYESNDLTAGSYTFTVIDSSLRSGETVYAVSSIDDMRDDSRNQHVAISLSIDQEATEQLAAEKQRLADEQKAEEEAEAKKAAEAAAAQKAAQEKAATTSSSASSASKASSTTNPQTVYVTKTGKKYHNDGCSSLKKSKIAMSLSEAEAEGYTPCKNRH
jgi:hypothetical protein